MSDYSQLKKLEFHDHLDGSLRAQSVWNWAHKMKLPIKEMTGMKEDSPSELEQWFFQAAHSISLEDFLRRFSVTTAVLQNEENLYQAAYEAVEDWHRVSVIYGEIRFAPENHLEGGLTMEKAVEAVSQGLKAAEKSCGVKTGLILCSMRQNQRSKAVAELCLKRQDLVCGFDLAGPERNYPASLHQEAFNLLEAAGFKGVTCHAGEDAGAAAVACALEMGAKRIGHGVAAAAALPSLREGLHRVLIECCLTSNEATGAVKDIKNHPANLFYQKAIPILPCCDDRLMCQTDLNREYQRAAESFGWSEKEFNQINERALDFAFGLTEKEKLEMKKNFIPKNNQNIQSQ